MEPLKLRKGRWQLKKREWGERRKKGGGMERVMQVEVMQVEVMQVVM